jgi:hypothetical protein
VAIYKVNINRLMINVGFLALFSATFGCLSPPNPHKMYSGQELDRSQYALIFGEVLPSMERLQDDRFLYVACVDGNCSEGDCESELIGWNQVSVLPGKHVITMCYNQRILGYRVHASPSFDITVEAGRAYWVRMKPPEPDKRTPLSIWVEDMGTHTRVPIKRIN